MEEKGPLGPLLPHRRGGVIFPRSLHHEKHPGQDVHSPLCRSPLHRDGSHHHLVAERRGDVGGIGEEHDPPEASHVKRLALSPLLPPRTGSDEVSLRFLIETEGPARRTPCGSGGFVFLQQIYS